MISFQWNFRGYLPNTDHPVLIDTDKWRCCCAIWHCILFVCKQIMVVCGNILARNNFEHFVLACAHQNDCYVEMEFKRWREFIVHVKEHLEANPSMQQELTTSEVISSAKCEEEISPAKVFVVEEPPENCLAEDMFVDVPPSSENDESTSPVEEEEEEDDEVDSSSMTVDCELGTRNSTHFAPLTKVSN